MASTDYRFSQALVARLMGLALAAVGAGILGGTVLVAAFGLPLGLIAAGVVLGAVAAALAALVATRRPYAVRLDDDGYRIRFIRGAGVKQGRWSDVEDAVATTVAGERCVVLRLRDGRTSTVPVGVLAGSGAQFVRDLQTHLDRGHGYRRLG